MHLTPPKATRACGCNYTAGLLSEQITTASPMSSISSPTVPRDLKALTLLEANQICLNFLDNEYRSEKDKGHVRSELISRLKCDHRTVPAHGVTHDWRK